MFSFKGKNPTKLYYTALQQLMKDGDECSPRGKLIKELRPSCFEFDNPNNRITFLGGRRINPFFQIAEALWILSGRADVEWLCKFNANMKQFSDDGIWFNAPYGERIRSWNKNSLHGVIINPIDQLVDAYTKLLADKDTRQAVIVISNPMFDNSKYTIGETGKDIACLTGDTVISSPEGDITIKELVESDKQNYPVYSYNLNTQTVEIQPVVNMALTRKSAKLIKITMGDGTVIKCTPDHVFYRKKYETVMTISEKGNKYPINRFVGYETVKAEDLDFGDRLPYLLRYEEEQGYVNLNLHKLSKSISDRTKEHILYQEYLMGRPLKDEEVVHHKNHKRNQNFSDNLEVLTKSYHDSLDMKNNNLPVGTSKKRAPKEQLTAEYLFEVAVLVIKSGKVLNKQEFQKQFDGVGCLSACEKHYGSFKNLRDRAYDSLGMSVPNGMAGSVGNSKATTVVNIENTSETEDVYDITVANNHNFFANGYLVHNCNLVITFKIRHNKLNMTVFNRSNDLHWGTMGANLNQFATIQETMLSWLKNSGNSEFIDLEIGTYSQITDSLHIYLDDYGSKCTQDVLDYYKNNSSDEVDLDFTCKNEPRMSYNKNSFDEFLSFYWSCIDPLIIDDNFINKDHKQVVELLDESVKDDYWNFGIKSMLAYRLVKINKLPCALEVLGELTNCQWKISMLHFLKHFIQKETDKSTYDSCVELYKKQVESIEEDLVNSEYKETLKKYLELGEATSE